MIKIARQEIVDKDKRRGGIKMFLSLLSKDYRFFSLKKIVNLTVNKSHKDLILNYYLTIEVYLIFLKTIIPGELAKKYSELEQDKYNLFLIKDLCEVEKLKYLKKGLVTFKDNTIYDYEGSPLVKLYPYSSLEELNKEFFDEFSTVILDERSEILKKDKKTLNLIEMLKETHSIVSVYGENMNE